MRGTSDEEGDTFISECIAFFNSVLAMGQCRNQNETCIGDEKPYTVLCKSVIMIEIQKMRSFEKSA